MADVAFLFPSYRPTAVFPELLRRLRAADPDAPIVVVDDGSGEDYRAIFDEVGSIAGVTLLRNAVNLGKGAALKHGMNYVLTAWPGCVGVVTADADGQHAVSDILRLRDALRSDPAVATLGARSFGRSVPLRSRFGNAVSRVVYRMLLGLHLADTQTGLRAVPRALMAASLSIRSNRYEFETEQLIAAKQRGVAIRELPIETIYLDDNRGSHFNPLLDSFRIYFILLRYALSSLATALADFIAFSILIGSNMDVLGANLGARAIALWIQFMLLRSYVFKTKAGLSTFAAYVVYVFFSGYVSSVLQEEFSEKLFASPLLAKAIVELVIWIFNFMFLRDVIFRRWGAR